MTSKTKPKHSWRFEAIGTAWSIETTMPLESDARHEIKERVELFDLTYSRFRDDSVVATMANKPGVFELPDDATALGELYGKLYEATSGAMSPLVGTSLNAAGYDKAYSFRSSGFMSAPNWHDVMKWHGPVITLTQPLDIDVGAVGKGLLIDEIANLIEQRDIKDYVIDASGDVRVRGATETIGLENPHDFATVIGSVEIKDESICASATTRRKWGNGMHHVLDARTGEPVRGVIATWVIAESTMIADGLATALFFVSASKLESVAKFDYVRLLSDGTVEYSKRFVGQLFT